MSRVIAREAPPGHISRLCAAAGLSRATFYRHRDTRESVDADIAVRDQIQRIALDFPTYGYRRITAQLRRRGVVVNHKRVLRLMREDNLLCLRHRRFLATTDSDHGFPVYPNLVPAVTLTGINQLWVADITYVRLPRAFIYLAVILDVFSRRCIGWALDRHLDATLTVAALRHALAERTVGPGLVHHSDRGVQYASHAYTELLADRGIRISMSRRGNPYDNAYAESFIKTLKYEEVYLNDYESLSEARASIDHFLEEVYNQKRLHSALGYLPPVEFEQTQSSPRDYTT
ncbi:MAG: IS3 family transposase [Acidobacteriaceae bacterium]